MSIVGRGEVPAIFMEGGVRIRFVLYMMVQHDPDMERFYQHLFNQGKKPKKVALVAVMRKMPIRLNAEMREYYLQIEGSPWQMQGA